MLVTMKSTHNPNMKTNSYRKHITVNGIRYMLTLVGGQKQYEVLNQNLATVARGCYIVMFNNVMQYHGKFSEGFDRRWYNLLKRSDTKVYRHNKAEAFLQHSNNSQFAVYVCSERMLVEKLKSKFGKLANMFNNAWLEEYTLRKIDFPFNKANNNKVLSKRLRND